MKYIITESQLDAIYFEYLDFLFDGLTYDKNNSTPRTKIWEDNSGKIVLMLKWDGSLWVEYELWSTFKSFFDLDSYSVIQHIMKDYFEGRLNLENIDPEPVWM